MFSRQGNRRSPPPEGSKSKKIRNHKKAPACRGLGLRRLERSVSSRDRCAVSTEPIIQPKRDHVDILADPAAGEDEPSWSDYACEAGIITAHPEMVVFDTERPIRCEAVLPAHAKGAAPTRVTCRCQADPGDVVEYIESVARHGGAALHVKQRGIPRPAELRREESDGVNLTGCRNQRVDQTDARILDFCPISLRFQAEHKLIGLPAVADLSASEAPGAIRATTCDCSCRRHEIHTTVALSPAAVGTDVESGPIIDRRDHRRRGLDVRFSSQISR